MSENTTMAEENSSSSETSVDTTDLYRGAAPKSRPDISDTCQWLKVASERLSQVRYVFLIQIEDGIPSASQRAALEYSDAVLMGWPDGDDPHLQKLTEAQIADVMEHSGCVEKYLRKFRKAERDDDSEAMAESLIRVTENVAQIRKNFQPDFLLPTFAEIRRVVEEEWNEDMAKIAAPDLKGARLRSGFQVEGVADRPHSAGAGSGSADAHAGAAD
ncbi:MAG: phosphoribosylglycinamide synthetase [Bifidobacteriaceae bacterium]|nr:phosphoribosylglycinamide synthetase [Bifidobacteriaceae bacterium]